MMLRRKCHVARRHFHIDHEIGARQREQDADQPAVEQDRVEHQLAFRRVHDGDGEGKFVMAVDRLAEK
jgi:hypothetical protein